MAHGLSKGFFWDLKQGVLFPLLEWVGSDRSLCLEIREDFVEIYYRGAKLLGVSPASIGYQVCLAPGHPRWNEGAAAWSVPDAMLGSRADVKAWIDIASSFESAMDLHWQRHPEENREARQMLLCANNFAGAGRPKDYVICDIDHATLEASLGMVAAHWPAAARAGEQAQRPGLAFVLAERSKAALAAPDGVGTRLAVVDRFLGDAGRVKALKDELRDVFNQKRALGLLDRGVDLDRFSDEQPVLLVALADWEEGDRALLCPFLDGLAASPRAELRFAACTTGRYGLFDTNIVGLEKAYDLVPGGEDVAGSTGAEPTGSAGQEPALPVDRAGAAGSWRTFRGIARTGRNRVLAIAAEQLPALVGLWLVVLGICARSQRLVPVETLYDEGVLLSNAHFLLRGLWPYRDFYSNYPPGTFLLLAAVWKVFGVSAWSYRLVGIGIHGALALLAGRLAGRIGGRRFSWLATGMVSVWTLKHGLIPHAWLAGLACGLGFIELWASARHRPTRARHLLAGTAYGLVGCFRHDLFVYFTLGLGLCWLAPRAVRMGSGWVQLAGSELRWLVLGAALLLGCVWGPALAMAGFDAPLRDMLIEQVRYVAPGRLAKMPHFFLLDRETGWPEALVNQQVGAAVQILLAPALAFYLLAARRRWHRGGATVALVGITALSLAMMPQMLQRSDLWHMIFSVTPALIVSAAFLEAMARGVRRLGPRIMVASALMFVVIRPVTEEFLPRRPLLTTGMQEKPYLRSSRRPGFLEPNASLAGQRRPMLDYIEKHTSARERVTFTNSQHKKTLLNEADLYFLADRLPGTRYTQYEPNMTSRREVQEEMIASLEQHQVRVVVLSSLFDTYYETQSGTRLPGSTLFDEYLRARFAPVARYDVYTILERRP